MKLSVQNYKMSKTNHTLIQKPALKGKTLTPKAFAAETEIIEKIKSLPRYVFVERTEFLKFYKNIGITPKIYRAITKRFIEVRQTKVNSDNPLKRFIESNKRIIEGYEWLLNNCRKLSKSEIAEITEISFDTKLPQDIRNNADKLLEKIRR